MYYKDSAKDASRLAALETYTSERFHSQDLLSPPVALYHHLHHPQSPPSQHQQPGHLQHQGPESTLSPHTPPSTHHQDYTSDLSSVSMNPSLSFTVPTRQLSMRRILSSRMLLLSSLLRWPCLLM